MSGDTRSCDLDLIGQSANFLLVKRIDGLYEGQRQPIIRGDAVDGYKRVDKAAYVPEDVARRLWMNFKKDQNEDALFGSALKEQLPGPTPDAMVIYTGEGVNGPQLSGLTRPRTRR